MPVPPCAPSHPPQAPRGPNGPAARNVPRPADLPAAQLGTRRAPGAATPRHPVAMGNCTSTWEELCHRGRGQADLQSIVLLHDAVVKFDNMPRHSVELLWRSFTQNADSFAITRDQLVEILMVLKDSIGVTDPTEAENDIRTQANELWMHWTSEERHRGPVAEGGTVEVIDAMEVLMGITFLSKMSLEDKANFVFDCVDFNGDNMTAFEEVCVSIKSIEAGLTKLRRTAARPASEMKIFLLASAWFAEAVGVPVPDDGNFGDKLLDRSTFVDFCTRDDSPANIIFKLYAEAEGLKEIDSDVEEEVAVGRGVEEDPLLAARGGGDEFMAVKPWLGAIVAPSEKVRVDRTAPSSQLLLRWVHGYASRTARGNVRYVPSDAGETRIVYNAAAVGVALTVRADGTKEQEFFLQHTDDVLCAAVSPDGRTVATSEIGARPVIHVWQSEGALPLFSLGGFHRRGVSLLRFSSDGRHLVSVGLDDSHSIAVYDVGADVQGGRLKCSSKGNKQKVFGVVCSPFSPSEFITLGIKHLDLWTQTGKGVTARKFKFLKKGKNMSTTVLAAEYLDADTQLAGVMSGDLYVFRGQQFDRKLRAHDATCNDIHILRDAEDAASIRGIVTGGKDGRVIVWACGSDLDPQRVCEYSVAGEATWRDACVRSVCFSSSHDRVLVGTQGAEIFELSYDGAEALALLHGGALVSGHSKDELWGLACHPRLQEFCTVGDDCTLRVWSASERRQLHAEDLGAKNLARACAYSPDGSKIAVGFGGSLGRGKSRCDGMVRIYSVERDAEGGACTGVRVVHEMKEAKKWISDVKFSPDGKTLAVGAHDNCVYLYNASQQFRRKGKFNKHNSYITHLDFSSDGNYLQSNCGAYELLFSDVSSGSQITSASSLRDVRWHTWTCTLGWPVQGIWPAEADGTDVNAVCRDPSGTVVATGDDFGKVRLFRYPCASKSAAGLEFGGHCSHVTNVRFTSAADGAAPSLISVGGNDRCILQWSFELDEDEAPPPAGAAAAAEAEASAVDEDRAEEEAQHEAAEEADDPFGGARGGGDEFMAVKPWLGAVKAPSPLEDGAGALEAKARAQDALRRLSEAQRRILEGDASAMYDAGTQESFALAAREATLAANGALRGEDASAPDTSDVELEWVYGYRAQDCRNNVRYSANGDVVYHAAALGVVLAENADSGALSQRFFRTHDASVIGFAMHPGGRLVATGEVGRAPTIYVWDSETMEKRATLGGDHRRGVPLLCFSDDGASLCSVGDDDEHSIAVYDWSSGAARAKAKGDRAKPLGVAYRPGSAQDFVVVGVKSIKLWTMQGRNLSSKKALLGKVGKPQAFTTAAFLAGELVVGCHSGELYFFEGRTLKAKHRVHDGPVLALHQQPDRLLSGGRDGKICSFSAPGAPDLVVEVPGAAPVRSVCPRADGEAFLVGTQRSEILEVPRSGAAPKVLVTGHFRDELWGLCAHPSRPEFATVGDDHTLRVWDATSKRMLQSVDTKHMGRAVDYSADGLLLAVGFGGSVGRGRQKRDGMLRVYGVRDDGGRFAEIAEQPLCELRDAKEWISVVRFSPDGGTLAAGAHDGKVYLYAVERPSAGSLALRRRAVFAKHNSYITHLDFSSDGNYLQSNCGAYELLFSDVSSGSQITSASSLRDVRWHTWTCTLGWPVQGIWPAEADGTDVNAVCRDPSGTVVATGDDFGKVRLFRYPCVKKGAASQLMSGHASHVTNVAFGAFDACVLSAGGGDRCVMQWRHEMLEVESSGDVAIDDATAAAAAASAASAAVETHAAGGVAGSGDGGDGGEADEESFMGGAARGGGDEFMAVKPYLGAIRAPKEPMPDNPRAPQAELRLDWVHGIATGCRNHVFFVADGALVYPAAAVGVKLSVDRSAGAEDRPAAAQAYHFGHTDDITCISVSPDDRFVATGQRGRRPAIRVWETSTMQMLCELEGVHQRGVASLCFTADGRRLLSVGADGAHSHALWQDTGGSWSASRLEAKGNGDSNKVLFCACTHDDAFPIVSGGARHVRFWKVEGKALKPKKALFKDHATPAALCAANLRTREGWRVVVGSVDGKLLLFHEKKAARATAAGAAAITTLRASEGGERLVSGSDDGFVKVWDADLQEVARLDARELSPIAGIGDRACRVKGVDVQEIDGEERIAIALSCAEVYEARLSGQSLVPCFSAPLTCGHYREELWGLCAAGDAEGDLFLTCGDDGTARCWSLSQRRCISCADVGACARAIAVHGANVVVGTGGDGGKSKAARAGGFVCLSLDGDGCLEPAEAPEARGPSKAARLALDCKGGRKWEWVSDVKFAPDGGCVAIGTHDNAVYLFDVDERGALAPRGALRGHNSYVTHVDWSEDGCYLQTNCGAYELLFWDAAQVQQVQSASKLKDTRWHTQTCVLGWAVQGIWPSGADGTDINAVDRSAPGGSAPLLVTAGDAGTIELFNYPCVNEHAESVTGAGHSSHVMNAKFMHEGRTIVSCGGNDRTVMIWKVDAT